MTILEGTLAMALISGATYSTLEIAEEVEKQLFKYQEAQKANVQNIMKHNNGVLKVRAE